MIGTVLGHTKRQSIAANILLRDLRVLNDFYLYLMIRKRIAVQNTKVIPLAKIMGKSPIKIPYNNQRNIPNVNIEYIPHDRSFVCFVLIVFKACGKNEMVVHVAATRPSTVMKFMLNSEIQETIKLLHLSGGLLISIFFFRILYVNLQYNHNIYAIP
jgi:hypothetical protein